MWDDSFAHEVLWSDTDDDGVTVPPALRDDAPLDGEAFARGAPRVILLLTDGEQSPEYGGPQAAIGAANEVKSAGAELFAVGFGSAQLSTLEAMATCLPAPMGRGGAHGS